MGSCNIKLDDPVEQGEPFRKLSLHNVDPKTDSSNKKSTHLTPSIIVMDEKPEKSTLPFLRCLPDPNSQHGIIHLSDTYH